MKPDVIEFRIEAFNNIAEHYVTVTHLPTGLTANAETRSEALRILRQKVKKHLPSE